MARLGQKKIQEIRDAKQAERKLYDEYMRSYTGGKRGRGEYAKGFDQYKKNRAAIDKFADNTTLSLPEPNFDKPVTPSKFKEAAGAAAAAPKSPAYGSFQPPSKEADDALQAAADAKVDREAAQHKREVGETKLQEMVRQFDENYPTIRGSVRPKEGETADAYEQRLRERSAKRREIAAMREKIAPFKSPEAVATRPSDKIPQGESFTGTSERVQKAAANTAKTAEPKSYSFIYDRKDRKAARQAFAREISGLGSYGRLSEDQQKRATSMGLNESDINKFYRREYRKRGI